jgi:cellulose synthase/poly-beta-1,6-N-acetylglucosamine synthase-like glycosyltransferase
MGGSVLEQNLIRGVEAWKSRRNGDHAVSSTRASKTTLISVIIPAHNDEDYLAQTLEALHGQNNAAS